jgi:hypothetical protein
VTEQATLFDDAPVSGEGNRDCLHPAGSVRASDPATSRAAAEQITGRTERQILAIFPAAGATDDELAALLPTVYPPTLKSARSRLANKRALVDSGTTRPSGRGCQMIVWTRP